MISMEHRLSGIGFSATQPTSSSIYSCSIAASAVSYFIPLRVIKWSTNYGIKTQPSANLMSSSYIDSCSMVASAYALLQRFCYQL